MRFDFDSIDEVDSFAIVPEGIYEVRVGEVREGHSRDGSTRWSMRLEVAEGDLAGRTAAWDSLTWSERGVHRVQQVLLALGLDATGEIEIEKEDLIGLQARVQLILEESEDGLTGRRRVRLRVPYHGFARSQSPAASNGNIDDPGSNGESCTHGTPVTAEPDDPF